MKALSLYHSKDMANVKVFTDRQTNRRTDGQAKNYMPPIFQCGGIKNSREKRLQVCFHYEYNPIHLSNMKVTY
jgi:hypothetical protein